MSEDHRPPTQAITGNHNVQAAGDVYIATPRPPERLPSLLAQFVPLLAAHSLTFPSDPSPIAYAIDEKIEFNGLLATKHWIEEYGQYGAAVDGVYDEFDRSNPNGKARILRSVRAMYDTIVADMMTESDHVCTKADFVRSNGDHILRRAREAIVSRIQEAESSGTPQEDVDYCAMVVVSHGFINCRLLERPVKLGNDGDT